MISQQQEALNSEKVRNLQHWLRLPESEVLFAQLDALAAREQCLASSALIASQTEHPSSMDEAIAHTKDALFYTRMADLLMAMRATEKDGGDAVFEFFNLKLSP